MEDHPDDAPPPWKLHRSEPGPDLVVCRARFDHLEHPRSRKVLKRLVLETPEWVNVIALTPAREVVLVEQFRFGIGAVTLEIPGGMVDPGEEPHAAARRELREETGFASEQWTYLGSVQPNPAIHDNACHHLLAEVAVRVGDPQPDPGEDLRVRLLALDDVRTAVRDGRIRHSLVITALAHLIDLRRT